MTKQISEKIEAMLRPALKASIEECNTDEHQYGFEDGFKAGAQARDSLLRAELTETARLIVLGVCEAPGYSSPDGEPNVIQISVADLATIIETELDAMLEGGK